jgi:hypothetical protein
MKSPKTWPEMTTSAKSFSKGISLVAALSTLDLSDHIYMLQIVYDVVHLSGIVIGAYLFSKYYLKTSKSLPVVHGT